MPREVIEPPMVVTKPIEGRRVGALRDAPYGIDVEFVSDKHTEEQFGLLGHDYIKESCVHDRFAALLILGQEVKVDYLMTHLCQSIIEVAMLEAESSGGIAVVILRSYVKNLHKCFASPCEVPVFSAARKRISTASNSLSIHTRRTAKYSQSPTSCSALLRLRHTKQRREGIQEDPA